MKQIDRADYVLTKSTAYDDSPQPIGALTKSTAYEDSPQPIGFNVTISAPHMHGYCLAFLENHLQPGNRVLDVGSGSGYLTAVMALLVGPTGRAVGVEHIPELVERSRAAVKAGRAAELMDGGLLSIHAENESQSVPCDSSFLSTSSLLSSLPHTHSLFPLVLAQLCYHSASYPFLLPSHPSLFSSHPPHPSYHLTHPSFLLSSEADGREGYPEAGPYDAIHVGAAAPGETLCWHCTCSCALHCL
ncbi:unnamed protein product [Closterium sp. Naga37s-1]|nr:unnamed protein product [Closterium sp. Naga37s-1]